ncbi:hypothetical protein ACIBKX_08985 [Streptomyces sp. NPDC050658]|uniref:hypothetical protein n=1 Tax=unclassified Streptomyces TaxID=2593676 RepID=UPI00343B9C79
MRPLCLTRTASPASGALRGMRAGALAVLCVLLPLAGHVASQGQAPCKVIVAAVAMVAVPGAVVLTRHRLTDAQLLGALAAAQLAHHLAYSLPEACAAVTARGESFGDLPSFMAHGSAVGPPSGVLVAGHLVTLLLAAQCLGVTEALLWQSRPLLAAVSRLLVLVWPLLGGAHGGTGPQRTVRESSSPLKSAVLARLHEGRAPPRPERAPLALFRPLPVGGPCLL